MALERIFIMHHGPATPSEQWEGVEDERPLSLRGLEVVYQVAGMLAERPIQIDRVLTSPLWHAMQTAEIVAAVRAVRPPVVREHRLSSAFSIADMKQIVEENKDVAALMLVGHEPALSRVTAEFCVCSCRPLAPSEVVCTAVLDAVVPHATMFAIIGPQESDGAASDARHRRTAGPAEAPLD